MLPVSPLSHFGIVKSRTAALLVQLFTTLALVPASQVVVLHTLIVAALQVDHVSHLSPLGIVKLNTAAELVQELVTDAEVQASPVVVVPTVIVAAAPSCPSAQSSPLGQVRVVLAFARVTEFPSVSPNTISFQLKLAEFILAQVSHFSHFRF